MKDNTQETSAIHDILNDVEVAVAAGRAKHIRVFLITIVCIGIIVALIGYVSFKCIQNRQFKEGILEAAILITSGYGVDDLTIISVNHDPDTVVFQSYAFANLSNKDKLKVFRAFNEQTGTYRWYLSCEKKGACLSYPMGQNILQVYMSIAVVATIGTYMPMEAQYLKIHTLNHQARPGEVQGHVAVVHLGVELDFTHAMKILMDIVDRVVRIRFKDY